MNLDNAIERFSAYLSAERALSPNTVRSYVTDLSQFAAFAESRAGKIPDVDAVTLTDVRGFLRAEVERGLNTSSMLRKTSSIRAFFDFLLRRGEISVDPTLHLSLPRKRTRIPPVIGEESIEKIDRKSVV